MRSLIIEIFSRQWHLESCATGTDRKRNMNFFFQMVSRVEAQVALGGAEVVVFLTYSHSCYDRRHKN